jgi:hypothetical protein
VTTRRIIAPAILALWLAIPCVHSTRAGPQISQHLMESSQVDIEYIEPDKPYLRRVYERLKKRQVLEQLKQFLAPLRWKQPGYRLHVTMKQCDATNSWYAGRANGLILCYEWPDWARRMAPKGELPAGFKAEDVVVGGFVQVVLHEMGHAVFDLLEVPVFGREEDAADQIAGFVMSEFGEGVARRTLTGEAYFWRSAAGRGNWPRTSFSDEHGTELQRYYNYLCIAYGGNPELFKDLVAVDSSGPGDETKLLLPKGRAANCKYEYEQIRNAFRKTIYPHIDPVLLKEVQSLEWLLPDDGK